MAATRIEINRAPVLTLWAAVVAERLGHPRATALTLGKAVAALNAQAKGQRLHLFEPAPEAPGAGRKRTVRRDTIALLGRSIPTVLTPGGPRAVLKDVAVTPASVERYLQQKFGDALEPATAAMRALAKALPPATLASEAYTLYERFRPEIPDGVRGWGAKGVLDLARLRKLVP